MLKNQEALPGESIFIRDQWYRQISDCHSGVVYELCKENTLLQLIASRSNF